MEAVGPEVTICAGDGLLVRMLVEVGGVEPPSENLSVKASTCVADVLVLAAEGPRRLDSRQPAHSFSSRQPRARIAGLSLPV